ncbi:uncharacterized protein JN550_005168 [Neoarthrinium moseri]|uniref:uncharacterized protein n=1 Tax=Neoarthrinium moseri TaxID=1658444 RepID=UPI001FDB9E33|nr:uncharacterized protein JN550_005168 [Neoarthrinium moseri]KAI1870625.1 hypothetical protein JN550_005168 [Neoarthrinium moseri]
MGRLGPLTSQALGRSPYDDAVEGTGEDDPHEPERRYDEKGRIVNPETKRIIKNVIRAHNEVMLVIGVAEPEHSAGDSPEVAMAKEHQAYESETGRTLLSIGRSLGILGIWGVHGVRQRIMLYQPYSNVEFWELAQYERQQYSLKQLLLTGLPSFVVMQGIHWTRLSVDWVLKKPWVGGTLMWCQFHFHLFLTMQRLNLIPASKLFPGVKFFIPFTNTSPIAPPPPIGTLSPSSVGGWLNSLALNVAPYVAFFLCGRIWNAVHVHVWPHIQKRLPHPSRNPAFHTRPFTMERHPTVSEETWQTVPESPTLGAADREIRHGRNSDPAVVGLDAVRDLPHHQGIHDMESFQDVPTLQALEGQASAADNAIPLGAVRRQSTFSSRGGDQDYGTDEEDADIINPTLISFDVDTTESTEQPTGVWSAELRPSNGVEGRLVPKEEPVYVVNPLTSLPSVLAADILTNLITYVLCAPFDAMAIRAAARAFARRRGHPMTNMYEISLLDAFSWRGWGNIIGLEIVRLLISGEIWAMTSILSQWLHVTDEEWREFHLEEQEEKERERRRHADQAASDAVARLEAAADAQA